MSALEFPILGEPLAVELANTSYGTAVESIDFLADRADVPLWFAAATSLRCPRRPSAGWHRQLLEFRDATRAVLDALAENVAPTNHALKIINSASAGAVQRRTLSWHDGAQITVRYQGLSGQRELAVLADAVIDFVASDQAPLVTVCAAEDCSMLFVRHHHRRRWCHDGCSHRNRQARYYQRHKRDPAK